MKRLTFLSIAELELTNAAEYYETQEHGLGQRFVDYVDSTCKSIRMDPDTFTFYQRPVRSCKVGPFPYRLLYRDLGEQIQIVAVFHLSRHPDSWKNRVK